MGRWSGNGLGKMHEKYQNKTTVCTCNPQKLCTYKIVSTATAFVHIMKSVFFMFFVMEGDVMALVYVIKHVFKYTQASSEFVHLLHIQALGVMHLLVMCACVCCGVCLIDFMMMCNDEK